MRLSLLTEDLNHILHHTLSLWNELKERNLFITGGTGFFGSWLLGSLLWANDHLGLNVRCVVLTRDPDGFRRAAPAIAEHPSIHLHFGDITNFDFPEGTFSHVIHAAATSAVATFNNEDPLAKFDCLVHGTRRVLDFAVKCQAEKILYTSSGAVYGRQPQNIYHIREDFPGAPNPLNSSSVWGESKRAAELLCTLYSIRYGFQVKIARCFSFVGPGLPLNIHYAVGNFIRDALEEGPIRVTGNGTPRRSLLYASDLAIWLWTIFLKGRPGTAFNVGSEEALSIREMAHAVSKCFSPPSHVLISRQAGSSAELNRYVPSTAKARDELGLQQTVPLPEALAKTVRYYRNLRFHNNLLYLGNWRTHNAR